MTAPVHQQQPVGSSSAAAQMAAAAAAAAVSRVPEAAESITWKRLEDRLLRAKTEDTTLSEGEKIALYQNLGALYFGYTKVDNVSISDKPQINYGKAIEWYKKAANLRDSTAMFILGYLYHQGKVSGSAADPTKIDYGTAIYWYTKAADLNDKTAMTWLGHLYCQDNVSGDQADPIKIDYGKAIYWYKKAANLRDRTAMGWLGQLYREGKVSDSAADPTKINYRKAIKWYKKAANLDDVKAMLWLGQLYREGNVSDSAADPIKIDYGAAIYWYTKAANLNDRTAMTWLGRLYSQARVSGPTADPTKIDYGAAIYWYTKAADLGDSTAMYWLGPLYAADRGAAGVLITSAAKVDLKEAFYWYRRYGLQNKTSAIIGVKGLINIPYSLKAYHLFCLETANFMAPGELNQITCEQQLKLIIKGLCQYEDNRLTPQDQRFAMLRKIIDKGEKYFDYMMIVMPVQEKNRFQNYLMKAEEESLRYKVISSIIDPIPSQAHGVVPELTSGSVHQKMPTKDYVIMIANLRVERAENARAQALSKEADDGDATRTQNEILKHILCNCLESIQGMLLYNPEDDALSAARQVLMEKLAKLRGAKTSSGDGKRSREEEAPKSDTEITDAVAGASSSSAAAAAAAAAAAGSVQQVLEPEDEMSKQKVKRARMA